MTGTKIIVGVVIGGVIGYAWHRLAGCPSGGCPMTRNPYISTLWGAFLGLVFVMNS